MPTKAEIHAALALADELADDPGTERACIRILAAALRDERERAKRLAYAARPYGWMSKRLEAALAEHEGGRRCLT